MNNSNPSEIKLRILEIFLKYRNNIIQNVSADTTDIIKECKKIEKFVLTKSQ